MTQPLPIPLPWERGFSPFTGELEGSEVSSFSGRFKGGSPWSVSLHNVEREPMLRGVWADATWSVLTCKVG